MRTLLLIVAAGWPALAQYGTTPKPKAADYPAQAQGCDVALGAEYLVRSVSYEGRAFDTGDYLAIEVALFPPKDGAVEVSSSQFALRINGKKSLLYAQAPGLVAASVKYPDWEQRPELTGTVGMGDSGVIIGQRRTVGRFPGDRRDADARGPRPSQVPVPTPAGVETQPLPTAEDAINGTALPAGRFPGPVSGHLYFAYKGKTKKIKSLELVWHRREQGCALKLF